MRPEKRFLLDDVLNAPAGQARREATLQAAEKIMRRRRAVRFAARSLAALAVAVLAALAVHQKSAAPQEQVQILTDDQLLALFPNVPVGLIKTPDGKKRLIFPRPGDEAKYIVHL